jgi:hypothetical protein
MSRTTHIIVFWLPLLFVPICEGICQRTITDSQELIAAMHSTYSTRWYKNITFSQRAIFYKDGMIDSEEIWHEAIKMPDKLIIKFNTMDSQDGMLFKSDSQFVFKDNKLIQRGKKIHDLMVLGFIVYDNPPAETLAKITACGFDVSKFSVETHRDSTFYVVGGEEARFWIDAKTLLFSKLSKKGKEGIVSEVIFQGYIPLQGGWIETEVLFLQNGKLVMKEIYEDIRVPESLSEDLFTANDFVHKSW